MDTGGSDPAPALPGFEPMRFGDLLERVFKITWRNKKTYAAIVAILVVPATLLFYSSFLTFPWEIIPATPEGKDIFAGSSLAATSPSDIPIERFVLFGALFLGGLVISMFGAMAASGAAIVTSERAHAGLPVDARSAVKAGLRRAHSLLWATLLSGLGAFIAFAFVLAPGIVPLATTGSSGVDVTSVLLLILMFLIALAVAGTLWLMWILAPVVVMSEPARGTAALRRSYRLVKGKVFWIGAVLFVAFAAQWTIGSVFTIPAAFMPLDPQIPGFQRMLFTQMVLGILPTFIYVPLQACVVSLLYVDARVRKEGLSRTDLIEELQATNAS